MDTHAVDYQKIHKPLSAFCVGTRPPAIRGNNSFLSDANENRRFNFKGFLGPVHVYHHDLSEAYLKRMKGSEVNCLPNHVLRISSSLGTALGRRRSFAGDAKGSFTNLLAFYHPLLVRGSVCPNAVGLDYHTLSDYRQNQAHLSVSVTVFRRALATASFAACGQRLPQKLIAVLNDADTLAKDSTEGAGGEGEGMGMVTLAAMASRVVSVLGQTVVSTGGGEDYLDETFPPLLGGTILLVLERVNLQRMGGNDHVGVGVIRDLIGAISSLMEETQAWEGFCKYLLLNRRIWEKAPALSKVEILHIISSYCARHPMKVYEMEGLQCVLSYLSECSFERKRQTLPEDTFDATYAAVSECLRALILGGGGGDASRSQNLDHMVRGVVESCVIHMSSLTTMAEVKHFVSLFEQVLDEADSDLRKKVSKLLIKNKFVEITLNILAAQEDKTTHDFCELVMVQTIPLFSRVLDFSQKEAESTFAESYYTMANLISMVVFSKEVSAFVGTREYCSILCSCLTNIKGSKSTAYTREQVLSGTCVLKSMMFLSPFILGLHRLHFEVQEAMLHDLTFLFCTSAENRRVFTSWDEWFISMLLIYLNAWSKGQEVLMNSCMNLIQVLAQHSYRGQRFFLFAQQVVCSSLMIKTRLYEDYLRCFGDIHAVYEKIDGMTTTVTKQLLTFAMEDLIFDRKPKTLPSVELCELNSLTLLMLIDRFFAVLGLCTKGKGQIDLGILSDLLQLKDGWVDAVKDAGSGNGETLGAKANGLERKDTNELEASELAATIIQQMVENTAILPEKNKVPLLTVYGSNTLLAQVLEKTISNFKYLESDDLDSEVLSLALKNLDILLQRGNVVRHIYKDKASLVVLIPLARLILVSWRLSTAAQRAEANHLGKLETLLSTIFTDSGERYQAVSFALTVVVYQEIMLSVKTQEGAEGGGQTPGDGGETSQVEDLLTMLMKLVPKWQTLLQDNLAQDSQAMRAIHNNTKINSLPAPLLLAQQNILSLSPGAVAKALAEVLAVQNHVLGSADFGEALGTLLTAQEIKQAFVVQETFVCRNFQESETAKDSLLRQSVARELAAVVREHKSIHSAKMHQVDLLNQENLQLSQRQILKLLKRISFQDQTTLPCPTAGLLPPGANRWRVDKMESSCRKKPRLRLCSERADYQPASERNSAPSEAEAARNDILKVENLLPVSKGMSFFGDEEEEEEGEGSQSEGSSPASSVVLTSPGGSQRGRETEDRKMKFEAFALLVTPKGTSLGWIDICKDAICFTSIDTEEEMAVFEDQNKIVPMFYMRSFVGDETSDHRKKKALEWHLDALSLMLVRRYCLRRSALEFFLIDRTSHFFDFGTPDLRQKAYQVLASMKPKNLHPLCYHSQNPEKLIKKSEITDQWVRREITNFEYLMYLNTFAGRSHNDITQYPVFPWILSDYESDTIDLADPLVYRDLSKPVGALDSERLKKFVERYESFEDDLMPKFHYGSHYSSSGIVLYYLLRLEPFAGLAVQLQGGKFDHADRLFDDLPGTWKGCLSDMSDVKELIPEFYYCPEMLRNVNCFNLGTRQDGKVLGDVKLPPWAKDASHFVSVHQQALESDYVSTHLHEWIDLVFGAKQRGEKAVKASNVFFYMTYEGQVDIDAITDPTQQKAALDQIAHFGQTPYQLFKEDHPSRMSMVECINPLFSVPSQVKAYEVDAGTSERTSAGQMVLTSESIVVISSLYPYQVSMTDFQANTPDSSGLPFSSKSKSKAFTAISALSQKLSAVTNLLDSGLSGWSTSLDVHLNFKDCVALSQTGRHVFACGYHDYTIRLCDAHSGKAVEGLRGNEQPTCLKLSQCGSILAVGFRNSTVGIWIVQSGLRSASEKGTASVNHMETFFFNSNSYVEWLHGQEKSGGAQWDFHRNLVFVNTLSFCCGGVKCLDVNTDLDTVVALTYERELVYHSLSNSSFTKVARVEDDAVMISNANFVVACDSKACKISCYSMNGALLRACHVTGVAHLDPLAISNKGKYLALCCSIPNSGTKVCALMIYDLVSMEPIFRHELDNFVASAGFSKDDTNLVTVLDAGEVTVFTDPATSLKLVDQMLRLGWQESGLEALQ